MSTSAGHILVVDDEYINRRLLTASLEQTDHTVVTAEDGQTALKLLRSRPFDVVLLDLLMPGIDGYTVLAEIKADDHLRHIPVIVISGLDDVTNMAQCIQLGATDYLPKPFNPLLLQARLNASLANKRLADLERESAARMQAILETAVDGIITFNKQGFIESVNTAVETLFHYPATELVGMPIKTLLPDLHIEATQTRYELIGRRQDQSQFPAEIGISRIPLPDTTLYTGIVRDLTTQHQIEQLRQDLTSTMVHDLRNPLTVILGMIELLSERNEMSDSHNLIDIAHSSAKRMIGLVNNILDVNRLESGQMSLSRDIFSLTDVIDQIIAMQSLLSEQKQLTFQTIFDDDLPLIVADLSLIERVLQNLVDNAIKFSPAGNPITITARWPENNATAVIVSVHNLGAGIPAKIQDTLFEKFVTGNQVGRGSGIGLSFCQLAIEAHNGKIWVESEPDQGTTFKFLLPITSPYN